MTAQKHDILFINSDDIVLEAINYELVIDNCSYKIAHTGEEAINFVKTQKFSIVLSDYNLPYMSGLQTLIKIKEISEDTVRILFTGFPSTDLYEKAINRGEVFKVITKPFSIEDLSLVIQRAIDFYELKQDKKELIRQLSLEVEKQSKIAAEIKGKYTHLFRSISEGYFQTEKNGLIININNAGAKIIGFKSIKEVLKSGISLADLYFDEELRKKLYRRLKKSHTIKNELAEIKRKDGKHKYVETTINVVYDSSGDISGFEGIFKDVSKRVGYRQKLDEATKYLRLIQNHIGEGILVLDRQYKIKSINKYLLEYTLNMSIDDVIDQQCCKIFYNFDEPCQDCIAKETFETGEIIQACRIRGDDKSKVKHIEMTTYPIFDESKNVVQVIETVKDISERVVTESKLRQTEKLYKDLVENINDAVLVDDINGNIVFVNSKFLDYFGYTQEEVMNVSVNDIVHPDDRERIMYYHFERLKGKFMPTIYEFKAITKSGKTLFAEAAVVERQERGVLIGTLAVIRDITFRREAEMKLERYTNLLEQKINDLSMMNSISKELQLVYRLDDVIKIALIAITARQGLDFDRAFVLLKDDKKKELVGKYGISREFLEEQSSDHMKKSQLVYSFDEVLMSYKHDFEDTETKIFDTAKQFRAPLKEEKNFLVRLSKEKAPKIVNRNSISGPMDQEVFDILDIFEFVSAPLLSKNKSLGIIIADKKSSGVKIRKDSVEWLGMLTNMISLAIENSLIYNTLEETIFKLEEMHQEVKDNQDKLIQAEKLSTIGELTSYIAHEIKNPLVSIGGFANSIKKSMSDDDPNNKYIGIIYNEAIRLERLISELLQYSKPMIPKFTAGNINKVLKDVLYMLSEEKNRIILKKEFDDSLPEFQFDPDQIRQVLINLIRNAFEAMPDGGSLDVKTSKNNSRIEIFINDTGPGISSENMKKLFKPFFTTKSKGTGLGLSVCKQIVKNHNGDIFAESKLGIGTWFKIILPENHMMRKK